MRLLVTAELLRQTFGLELPIEDIRIAPESPDYVEGTVFEFMVGDGGTQHLLRGDFMTHQCPMNGERWYAARYEVLDAVGEQQQ